MKTPRKQTTENYIKEIRTKTLLSNLKFLVKAYF
jgi:hypothetical protein